MSEQHAHDSARIVNSDNYFEINLGETTLKIPISVVMLVGAGLMLFAFIGMTWVQILISFTGLDLTLELARNLSNYNQLGYTVPLQTQIGAYLLYAIPIAGVICAIQAFRLTIGQSKDYDSVWNMALVLAGLALVAYIFLYADLLNSLIGRYFLQSGFWFSALGCIIVIASAIAGKAKSS